MMAPPPSYSPPHDSPVWPNDQNDIISSPPPPSYTQTTKVTYTLCLHHGTTVCYTCV